MAVLLLRLAAPLQSWGAESKFETRRTLGFPTKSGVIGLLAAALGYSREEPLDRLNALHFGVRVDREGELLRDYHIAKGKKEKDTYITYRYYLSDAVFLAGLESKDATFLTELSDALRHPAYPLYLGRRACPPTMPLLLGIRETDLLTALKTESWLLPEWRQLGRETDRKLRILTDGGNTAGNSVLRDVPVSFSQVQRQFVWRSVQDHGYMEAPASDYTTSHDAFTELR